MGFSFSIQRTFIIFPCPDHTKALCFSSYIYSAFRRKLLHPLEFLPLCCKSQRLKRSLDPLCMPETRFYQEMFHHILFLSLESIIMYIYAFLCMKVRFGSEKSLYRRAFLIRQPMCLLTHKWLNKIIQTYTGQAHKSKSLLLGDAQLTELTSRQPLSSPPHTSPANHPARLRSRRLLLVMMFKAKMVGA